MVGEPACRQTGAESKGFEPLVPRRVQQFSRLPRSTTPAALRFKDRKIE
jgi:hypothetical protein